MPVVVTSCGRNDYFMTGMKPHITLFVGVLAVSFAAIFIRLADAPPLVIATYRLTIASVILIPVALLRCVKSLKLLSKRDLLLILFSSILIALHFVLWITSLSYTSIASSLVLVTSHPAFVAVVSYFLWSERINRLLVTGIVVAFVGVILTNYIGLTFGARAVLGNSLALIAGLAMGAYLVIGRQLKAHIDVLSYLTSIYACSAIMLLVATMISGQSLFGYSNTTYVMLLLLALVPQLIGHSCLNLAVRSVSVTFVSVAILGEPVGATLLGYFILSEIPTTNEIIGGLTILAGIFIVTRQKPKHWLMR